MFSHACDIGTSLHRCVSWLWTGNGGLVCLFGLVAVVVVSLVQVFNYHMNQAVNFNKKTVSSGLEIEFPWNQPEPSASDEGFSDKLRCCLDTEARRRKTLEAEKEKWRELQQQLATLRSVRTKNQADALDSQQLDNGVTVGAVKSDDVEIPWKDTGNVSLLRYVSWAS